jgi:baculoviral IAP repeat-containing protein 5
MEIVDPMISSVVLYLQVAEAGFYYCGTPSAPDWTRCIVCHVDIDGWEATDDPL